MQPTAELKGKVHACTATTVGDRADKTSQDSSPGDAAITQPVVAANGSSSSVRLTRVPRGPGHDNDSATARTSMPAMLRDGSQDGSEQIKELYRLQRISLRPLEIHSKTGFFIRPIFGK